MKTTDSTDNILEAMRSESAKSETFAQVIDYLGKMRVDKEGSSQRTAPFNYVTKPAHNIYGGKYFIDAGNKDTFFKYVCDAVYEGNIFTIAEKSERYGPLRVDFDFKAPISVGLKRQYDETLLKEIVSFYQKEIKSIVSQADYSDDMLTCIVLEKESPRIEINETSKESQVKDGFHFHFPHFICEERIQD